jgi:hypothetical protein
VTINSITGELRTGKDKVDYEKITSITYTVVASDGVNSEEMLVSYI